MDLEEPAHLVHHVVEVTRLVAAGRLGRIAVHRVAAPHDRSWAARVLDGRDDAGQPVADHARTHPGDDREPPGDVVGVERLAQLDRLGRVGRRPELHADRVVQPGQEIDVGTADLPGPLPHPHQVGGQVVRLAVLVGPGQRALILQQQRLVAGVELDAVRGRHGLQVQPARAHERERALDVGRERLVALTGPAALDEVDVPVVHSGQVRRAVGGHRTHEVQRRGAVCVSPHHPLRVRGPLAIEVIDGITTVGRKPGRRLDISRARLGVLPCQPPQLDHRQAGTVGEHDGHLQQGPYLAADALGGVRRKRLGAVAALEQEGLAPGHCCQPEAQCVALLRLDERRHLLEGARHLGQDREVGPRRLLRGG